jgi:hypothetical protein
MMDSNWQNPRPLATASDMSATREFVLYVTRAKWLIRCRREPLDDRERVGVPSMLVVDHRENQDGFWISSRVPAAPDHERVALTASAGPLASQAPRAKMADDPQASVPALSTLINRTSSELADVVERFAADQQSLGRRYDANESPAQRRRMRAFYTGWRSRLGELSFDKLGAGRSHRLRPARQLSPAPNRAPRPSGENARRDGRAAALR